MKKARAHYRMVAEDDTQWMRFWDAYPRRCAKKEARKAWVEIDPTPADVDKMLTTLAWQTEEWAREQFRFCPYPASWLRAERWTDEPPPQVIRRLSNAASAVFATLGVKPS